MIGSDGPAEKRPPGRPAKQGPQGTKITTPKPPTVSIGSHDPNEEKGDQPRTKKGLFLDHKDVIPKIAIRGFTEIRESERTNSRVGLVNRRGPAFNRPLPTRDHHRCERPVKQDQRIENRHPVASEKRHHQGTNKDVILSLLPGRPGIPSRFRLLNLVEGPTRDRMDRPQGANPAAKDPAKYGRDYQRDHTQKG